MADGWVSEVVELGMEIARYYLGNFWERIQRKYGFEAGRGTCRRATSDRGFMK
jgi:hypothetical protein